MANNTNSVTNIRQAENSVEVIGIVSEKDLKEEIVDGVKQISGSVTVKTSDVNFVRFNVKASEKKRDGSPSSIYSGLVTVMNEYKSIAEVGEENADKVRISSSDSINLYRSKQTGNSVIGFKTNFFNRVKSSEDYEPKADFAIETYIKSITPEVNTNGEETGRILVRGWCPTYSGIEEITLVAEGEIASAVESTFEIGQTVEFYGEIVNNRVETVREIPVAIGKPRIERKVSYKNDMVITGASEAYEEGGAIAPYTKEAIDKALQERENKIAEEKAKSNSTAATKPSAAAHGRTLGF